MKEAGSLIVIARGEHEIAMTCPFDTERRLVFDVYTKPEVLKRRLGARGVCRESSRPERLVCTESFDDHWYPGESLIATVLVEQGGATVLKA